MAGSIGQVGEYLLMNYKILSSKFSVPPKKKKKPNKKTPKP
jgi:hypothetical protein